ncbi:MAG TPA: hypothetical protein VIT92_11905 [Burkholderiaceae bacterium]
MKDPKRDIRKIVVKALVTPSVFLALEDECKREAVSMSSVLFSGAQRFIREQQDKRNGGNDGPSWPCRSHNVGKFCPGGRSRRAASPAQRMRL